MPRADFRDPRELARIAAKPHENDGARARRDLALDVIRIETQMRVDVGEHRLQVRMQNRVVGRDERDRRGDNFIAVRPAVPLPVDVECQMQAARRRIEKMSMRKAAVALPSLFERDRLEAGAGPSFFQAFANLAKASLDIERRDEQLDRHECSPLGLCGPPSARDDQRGCM